MNPNLGNLLVEKKPGKTVPEDNEVYRQNRRGSRYDVEGDWFVDSIGYFLGTFSLWPRL